MKILLHKTYTIENARDDAVPNSGWSMSLNMIDAPVGTCVDIKHEHPICLACLKRHAICQYEFSSFNTQKTTAIAIMLPCSQENIIIETDEERDLTDKTDRESPQCPYKMELMLHDQK